MYNFRLQIRQNGRASVRRGCVSFQQLVRNGFCHFLHGLDNGSGVVQMQLPDFVMHKAVVNRNQFRQANRRCARQTDFRPALHRHVGRFARRMRREPGEEQIYFARDAHQTWTAFAGLKI